MTTNTNFYRLHIQLNGIEPMIWRRIEVDGTMSLDAFEWLLQEAMEWDGFHLSEFRTREGRYGDPEGMDDPSMGNKRDVSVSRVFPVVGAEVEWIYDFGDEWRHTLRLEGIRQAPADECPKGLLDGENASPEEDSGGPLTYQMNLAALARGESVPDWEEDMWTEAFDPATFEIEGPRADVKAQIIQWRYRKEMEEVTPILEWMGAFPEDVVRRVESDRERFGPLVLHLARLALRNLRLGEEMGLDPGTYIDEVLGLIPFYILSFWEEKDAFPLLLQLGGLEEETLFAVWDDYALMDFPRMLAMTCHGRLEELGTFLCDPQVGHGMRGCAVDALLSLYRMEKIDREETTRCLVKWMREDLPRTPGWVWDYLMIRAMEVNPTHCREEVERAWNDGLAKENLFGWDWIGQQAEDHPEGMSPGQLPELLERMESTVEEMQDWSVWEDGLEEEEDFLSDLDNPPEWMDAPSLLPDLSLVPIRREGRKVGRNDPCPCGSGKKYKKCCGR